MTYPVQPTNDTILIEMPRSEFATADETGEREDPRAGFGTVVAIPDQADIMYFGSFHWAFDESLFNEALAKKVHARMKQILGKKVYFEKHAEKGMVIEDGDHTYALIKLTKIVGVA